MLISLYRHSPLQVPETYLQQYRGKPWSSDRKIYAGMLSSADEALGRVRDALIRKGMWQDTLVIYQTDNGGAGAGKVRIMNYGYRVFTLADSRPSACIEWAITRRQERCLGRRSAGRSLHWGSRSP